MAETNSTQFANMYVSSPRTKVYAKTARGRMRYAYFSYTQAANGTIADTVQLVKVPPNCTIQMLFSWLSWTATWTNTTTVDLGWKAYTNISGTAVAVDVDGLMANLDLTAARGHWIGGVVTLAASQVTTYPVADIYDVKSKDQVTITAQFNDSLPVASGFIEGAIAYTIA